MSSVISIAAGIAKWLGHLFSSPDQPQPGSKHQHRLVTLR
jgi:hypothetical protein